MVVGIKNKGNSYLLSVLSVPELNRILAAISTRMDQMDAIGQYPDMRGQKLINLGLAEHPGDAVRFGQLQDQIGTMGGNHAHDFLYMRT